MVHKMEREVEREFKKIWRKIKELEKKILPEKGIATKLKSSTPNTLQKIIQAQIRLIDYPVDKFDGAMEKCLSALKLAKDVGVEDNLLTTDIRDILKKKLRAKKIPSMSVISNAMKKAEKKGYVTSLSIESGEKRQRKYRIHENGERHIQNILGE